MARQARRIDDDDREIRQILKAVKNVQSRLDAQEPAQTAILNRLELIHQQGVAIMSAISDFVAKQKAYNERTGAAIDGIVTDIQTLNDKITELQNSAGTVTPEDQALIDEVQTMSEALATKAEALDAQTPPAPPPVA